MSEKLTFRFVKNVFDKTGVNILGLTGTDWLKTSPDVQVMLINEYRLHQHKPPLSLEAEIPEDFYDELFKALTFFSIVPNVEAKSEGSLQEST